jgi:ferrous iron transport protein A
MNDWHHRISVILPSFDFNQHPIPSLPLDLHPMKRLSEVSMGSSAVIHSFEKDDLFLKLMEMGFVPGEIVRVEQVAPLGDPISLTVAGYQLSLRLNEAELVWVDELTDLTI